MQLSSSVPHAHPESWGKSTLWKLANPHSVSGSYTQKVLEVTECISEHVTLHCSIWMCIYVPLQHRSLCTNLCVSLCIWPVYTCELLCMCLFLCITVPFHETIYVCMSVCPCCECVCVPFFMKFSYGVPGACLCVRNQSLPTFMWGVGGSAYLCEMSLSPELCVYLCSLCVVSLSETPLLYPIPHV